MSISPLTFKTFCTYVQRKTKCIDEYDNIIRKRYNESHHQSAEYKNARNIVQSVWDINKFRFQITRRILDFAIHKHSRVLPLLRLCKEVPWITMTIMKEQCDCDISGAKNVSYCTEVCINNESFRMRSDIAEIIKYFLIMCWYPEYLTTLYINQGHINAELQLELLILMEKKLVNVMIAESKQR